MWGSMANRGLGMGSPGPSSMGRYGLDEWRAIMKAGEDSVSPSGGSPSSDSKKEKGKSLGERVKAVGKAISPKKIGKK